MLSKTEFKDQFKDLPEGFSHPVVFTDDSFGFSLLKDQPNGYASLFKIYIIPRELSKKGPLKMVEGSVSYGKKTKDGIVLSSSSERIRSVFDPLDLLSADELSFNSETNKFFYKDKEITAQEVITLLDKWHLKITKTVRGSWLRAKIIWFHYLLAKFWKTIFIAISGIQYLATGEKVKIFHSLTDSSTSLQIGDSNLYVKESRLINLWGYEVKPWIAGVYAASHLIIYFIFYLNSYRPSWLITIFQNSFLTFMYGIVSLGLANTFLPILLNPVDLKKILKVIQNLYIKSAFRKIKI